MVGPGKPIDTDRYFVICANVVGGCMGTTGPASTNPATGRAYGLDLPMVTIADMVRAQAMLIDRLGIDTLFCVAGGSMGGMQVLQWAASYPERVFSAMPIATSAKHSSQNIAFHEVGRQAIMADPDWRSGRYLAEGVSPTKGLAVARMAAHITYLSDDALQRQFGRKLQDRAERDLLLRRRFPGRNPIFAIRARPSSNGSTPNSYLFMTRAMDYFDLAADYDGSLARAFQSSKTRFCIVSFTSDWLFPTSDSRAIVHALNAERRLGVLRRNRNRQRPRRFPARRARPRSPRPGDSSTPPRGRAASRRRRRRRPHEDGNRELTAPAPQSRIDLVRVADMVEPRARVLDVGCGDGALLRLLAETRAVDGRGMELSQSGVNDCVAKGLSVIQGDADIDLADYPDDGFDYVILSQTLQATRQPRVVMEHMLRIGRRAIVSFPNFGHWRIRAQTRLQRPHAGDGESRLRLVRHAEYPLLHDPGFRAPDAGDRCANRNKRRARQPWPPVAGHPAVVGVEPAGRAGGVSAAAKALNQARSAFAPEREACLSFVANELKSG